MPRSNTASPRANNNNNNDDGSNAHARSPSPAGISGSSGSSSTGRRFHRCPRKPAKVDAANLRHYERSWEKIQAHVAPSNSRIKFVKTPVFLNDEQHAKLDSELDMVRRNVAVLKEMTLGDGGGRSSEERQFVRALHATTNEMKRRVVKLVTIVQNSAMLARLTDLLEETNDVLLQYNETEREINEAAAAQITHDAIADSQEHAELEAALAASKRDSDYDLYQAIEESRKMRAELQTDLQASQADSHYLLQMAQQQRNDEQAALASGADRSQPDVQSTSRFDPNIFYRKDSLDNDHQLQPEIVAAAAADYRAKKGPEAKVKKPSIASTEVTPPQYRDPIDEELNAMKEEYQNYRLPTANTR